MLRIAVIIDILHNFIKNEMTSKKSREIKKIGEILSDGGI